MNCTVLAVNSISNNDVTRILFALDTNLGLAVKLLAPFGRVRVIDWLLCTGLRIMRASLSVFGFSQEDMATTMEARWKWRMPKIRSGFGRDHLGIGKSFMYM